MQQVLTLRELGERYGVDLAQIKRLVRVGSLPEAVKEDGPTGKRWVIPIGSIAEVANRHGWEANEINLDENVKASAPLAITAGQGDTVTESRHPEYQLHSTIEAAPGTTLTDPPPQVDVSADTADVGTGGDNATGDNGTGANATGDNGTGSDYPSPSPMSLTPLRRKDNLQPPLPPEALKVKRREPEVSRIPALSEILNEDLLTRLLGAHEDKATARARVKETERALTSLTASHRHVSMQLSEERKEREILADRLREERNARLQSEAKVAELHQRVARETAIAESEQRARHAATDRSIKAERDAATALGSMGVVSRRKYDRRAKKRS